MIGSLKDGSEVIEVDTLIEFIGELVIKLFETADLNQQLQNLHLDDG